MGEDLVKEYEPVESRAAGEVEASYVEGTLCTCRYSERDAGAAGGEHSQGARKHLTANRVEDEVVRAVLVGGRGVVTGNHFVCSKFLHQRLAISQSDQTDDMRTGHPSELAGEETDPARGPCDQDLLP